MEIELNDLLSNKREEIRNQIVTEFKEFDKVGEVAEIIVKRFCNFQPPTQDLQIDKNITYTKLDHTAGLLGGISKKNGNIFLSWKRLLFDSAEHTLTLVGAVTTSILAPIVIPFAALVVWNKLWSMREIKIDERHAMVLVELWKNRNQETNLVLNEGIIAKINETLVKYDRPKMQVEEYSIIINDLSDLKVLELNSSGSLWLRDWVKVPYC